MGPLSLQPTGRAAALRNGRPTHLTVWMHTMRSMQRRLDEFTCTLSSACDVARGWWTSGKVGGGVMVQTEGS